MNEAFAFLNVATFSFVAKVQALAAGSARALWSKAADVPWDVVGVLVGIWTLWSIRVAASGLWLERLPILHARRLEGDDLGVVNSGRGTALNVFLLEPPSTVVDYLDVIGPGETRKMQAGQLNQDVTQPAYMVYTDAFGRWHHSKVVFNALAGRSGPVLTRFYAGQWKNLRHRVSPLTFTAQRELARRSLSMQDYMRIGTSWWRYRAWKWWLPGALIRTASATLRWLYSRGEAEAFADSPELKSWLASPTQPSPATVPSGFDDALLAHLKGAYRCWHREYDVREVRVAADNTGRVALQFRLHSFWGERGSCGLLLERRLVQQLQVLDELRRTQLLWARVRTYLNRRRPDKGEKPLAVLTSWSKPVDGVRVRGAWVLPVEVALGDGMRPAWAWVGLLVFSAMVVVGFVLTWSRLRGMAF